MKKILSITILTIGLIAFTNAQGITNTLGGNSATDKFIIENSDSEAGLVVTGEGNVGIGTPNPERQLHIDSGATGDADAVIGLTSASSFDWSFGIDNNDLGKFKIANAVSGNPLRDNALVTISATGNVGIGTTNPLSKLSVGGDGHLSFTIYGEVAGENARAVCGIATNYSGNNYGGFFEAAGSSGNGVFGRAWNGGDVTNFGGYFVANGNSGRGVYGYAAGTNGQGVRGDGQAYDFYAVGPGTNYGAASSIRWKRNIVEIDNPLEKLAELRGVYFNWDEEHGSGHDVGMIAEEVGKVLPEIVVYEENGIDANGMDYSMLTPLLVEAVKELQKIVEDQQKRIEVLENN